MNKSAPSQASIAKHLGVSQALVSMVLNGRQDGIAPATFKRIWDQAIASGYMPKGMKVNLAKTEQLKATGVGYFLRAPFRLATKTNFFSHVSQGLHDFVSERGLNLIFLGSEADDLPKMRERLRLVRNTLKGVVVLGEVGPEFLSFVRDLDLPTVIVSSRETGVFHSINSNELKAAEMLAEHLYELGHRKFCFIGGTAPMGRYLERKDAVLKSLERLGVKEADSHFVQIDGGADRKEGMQATRQVLDAFSSESLPTAWIVSNGTMARGVCTGLLHAGLAIGKDVSVAAIDMTRACWDEEPALTSAAAIPEEMGFEAGRLVVGSEQGTPNTFQDLVLPVCLEVRESTGKPAKMPLLSS